MKARLISVAAGLAVALLALSGCAKMDAALDQQQIVVTFGTNTSVAGELKVRAACSHIPNAPPTALPKQRTWNVMLNAVGFDVTNASDGDTARLEKCLTQFKSVQGVTATEAGDAGD
jgi:hypothetical protein